jgi:regulation of enolase protein 1 (concanavalin A-like superfamily)
MRPIDLAALQHVGTEFGKVEVRPDAIMIHAGPGTDAFVPPDGGPGTDRLPGLRLAVPASPWAVSAHVQPTFRAGFDAGALVLRTEGATWAKLAFECAPDMRTMAVSVVTRDRSDDANGPLVAGPGLWLRACWTGKAHAFHISTDGKSWDFLRFFSLPEPVMALEFIAQSPTGQGCSATFTKAQIHDRTPHDLRDGS